MLARGELAGNMKGAGGVLHMSAVPVETQHATSPSHAFRSGLLPLPLGDDSRCQYDNEMMKNNHILAMFIIFCTGEITDKMSVLSCLAHLQGQKNCTYTCIPVQKKK